MGNDVSFHVCADLKSCRGHRQMRTLAAMTTKVAKELEARGLGTIKAPFAPRAKYLLPLEGDLLYAQPNIVLDGCPYRCRAAKLAGEPINYIHLVMTDLGAKKGYTPIAPDVVTAAVEEIARTITAK